MSSKKNTALLQTWVPPSVHEALTKQAAEEGITVAGMIRRWAKQQAAPTQTPPPSKRR